MRNDNTAWRDRRRHLWQTACNVFIRKTVKAVAAHTLRIKAFRNGEMIGERPVAAMKGGIKTGDLRQVRKALEEQADGREIVWLVKRSEGNVTLEFGKHVVVNQHRPIVFGSAVDDAVPHCNGCDGLLAM